MLDTPFSLRRRDALKLTLVFVLAQVACGIVVGFVGGFAKAIVGAVPEWASAKHPAVISLINIVAAAFALGYALRQTKTPVRELFALRPPRPKVFAVLLLVFAGYVALNSEISNAVQWLWPTPPWLRGFMGAIADLAQHPWAAPFALVIMAPITEELFFRGLILRRLLASVPAWSAIWTSALLFMAMHLNPWQFPIALGLGLLVGWIYARTRSLALCLAAHAFVNASSLLSAGLPFTIRGFNAPHPAGTVLFQPWWLDLGGAAALGAGLYLFTRWTPPLPPPPVRAEPPLLLVEVPPLPAVAPAVEPPAIPTAATASDETAP